MPAAAAGQEPERLEAERLAVHDRVHPDDRGVSHREHDRRAGVGRVPELAAGNVDRAVGWNARRLRGDAQHVAAGDGEGPVVERRHTTPGELRFHRRLLVLDGDVVDQAARERIVQHEKRAVV